MMTWIWTNSNSGRTRVCWDDVTHTSIRKAVIWLEKGVDCILLYMDFWLFVFGLDGEGYIFGLSECGSVLFKETLPGSDEPHM